MAGNPLTDPNWAPNVADTIVRVVGTIRDRATDRAVVAVRALVFGIVIGIAGLAAIILGFIVGTRFVQVICGRIFQQDHDTTVWISYYVIAALLLLAGLICMRLRRSKAEPA